MKKFLRFPDSACRGAALIVVLAVMGAAVSPISAVQPSPTPSPSQTPSPSPTASPAPGCVAIATAQIATGGSFYRVGDILDPGYGNLCAPADNFGFRLQVASVDSNGGVTGVTIVAGVGIGYSNPPSNPVPFGGSPTGTGFTANCTFH